MSKQIKPETSITEDIFTGIGSLLGSAIGVTAEVAKDTVVGVLYDMPKAIVAGFEDPKFSFGNDDDAKIVEPMTPADVKGEGIAPDKVEPAVITKEEYVIQLQKEMDKVQASIDADDTVEVTITGKANDNS